MTFEKWTVKASAIADEMLMDGCRAGNYPGGAVVFDKPGHVGYVLEAQEVLTAARDLVPAGSVAAIMDKASRGTLAETKRAGITENGRKAYELTSQGRTVYVQKKYINLFPRNAHFYISGPADVVAVGLMDRGPLHIIGVICPIRTAHFTPEA